MFEDHLRFKKLLKNLYNDLETELIQENDNDVQKRIKQKYKYLIEDLVTREKRQIYNNMCTLN